MERARNGSLRGLAVEMAQERLCNAATREVVDYMSYHVDHPPDEIQRPIKSGAMRVFSAECAQRYSRFSWSCDGEDLYYVQMHCTILERAEGP